MKHLDFRPAALALLLGASCAGAAEVPSRVTACDDAAEFPPFAYYERQDGHKTRNLVGLTVEVLDRILAATGRTASVSLLPWHRCVELVRLGEVAIALDAARTPGRDVDYVFTSPVAVLTPTVYYRRSRPIPEVKTSADFAALRMCGLFGYLYPGYGVPDALVYHGPKTLEAAPEMLRAGHCDVFLADAEHVAGVSLIAGHPVFPGPEFAWQAAPGPVGEEENLDFMIGRALPYHAALRDLLEQGLQDLRDGGALERLRAAYLASPSPDGPAPDR